MTDKAIKAIIRHERAVQEVDSLTRRIGVKLNHCPLSKVIYDGPFGGVDERGRTKTHLWHAFQHREQSSCGYGMVGFHQDEIEDALSRGSDYACRHCRRAWQLILRRKEARQELGSAKRSIRALGRAALAMEGRV